jgi:hypothetical protein
MKHMVMCGQCKHTLFVQLVSSTGICKLIDSSHTGEPSLAGQSWYWYWYCNDGGLLVEHRIVKSTNQEVSKPAAGDAIC